MRNGTPTIATAIGAEGIPDFSSIHDNPEEFANAAIATYIDKTIWSQLQKDGLTSINLHFAKEKGVTKFFDTITTLERTLSTHRRNNFIGTLLQHQSLASTKFMSKWIEEKNK